MKKILFLLLIGLIAFDVDAQLLFNPKVSSSSLTGISTNDEFSSMMAKKRKKRKSPKRRSSGKRGGSRGGSASGLNVGGGLTFGLPMGDFGKAVKTGMGLHVEGDYSVTPQISAGFSTGYLSFKYKSDDLGGSGSFKIIPLVLKGTYYLMTDDVKPYVGLGLGLAIDNSTYEFSWPYYFQNEVTGELDTIMLKSKYVDKSTDFVIVPTFGVMFTVGNNLSLNVAAKYNIFSVKDGATNKKVSYSYLGLNLGLVYTIGL